MAERRRKRTDDAARIEPDDQLAPRNLDAEKAVLGACLLRREAAELALEQLQPEDFWRDAHQRIFRAMGAVVDRHQVVDLLTVSDVLEHRSELTDVGGPTYISALTDGMPRVTNIESYCAILIDMHLQRGLLDVSRRIAGALTAYDSNGRALAEQAEAWIAEVAMERGSRELQSQDDILKTFIPALEERMARRGELLGVTSGFTGIDEITRGFHAEDLTIIAARPGMGKSSLMLNMARAAANSGKFPAVFSMEMPKDRLEYRLVAAASGVPLFKIQKGWLSDEDIQRIGVALTDLSAKTPIYIDDTPSISVAQMRAKCRTLRAKRGLDIVFVDYVQLMRPSTAHVENRQREVAEISGDLKLMARKLRVPVVAMSQLSRRVEERPNKRPLLSDLRESGSLEQDADNVAYLYRHVVYSHKPADVGSAEYGMLKHRDGDLGVIALEFKKEIVRFFDDEDGPPVVEVPEEIDDQEDRSRSLYD